MANKPKTIKKWKRRGKEKKTTTTLSEKKGEARNVSEQRDKGCT